jgi:hypothetical protein
MKHLLILLLLASCGKNIVDLKIPPKAPKVPTPMSIFNDFEATSEVVVIQKLNLSQLTFGSQPAGLIFNCNVGVFGDVGLVNGVDQGQVSVIGNNQTGIIQFGHIIYSTDEENPSDPECRNVSHEGYVYEINGDVLTLTMVNDYPIRRGSSTRVHFSTTYKKKAQ